MLSLEEIKADALQILEEEGGNYWDILKFRFGLPIENCKKEGGHCHCPRSHGILSCKYAPY